MDPYEILVEFSAVNKYFDNKEGQVKVLDSINFTVLRNELIAIYGSDIYGRSVIMNLISGLEMPSSGHVCVRGISYENLKESQITVFRRRNIGLVRENFFMSNLNVYENIMLPLNIENEKPREAYFKRIISFFGLENILYSYIDDLTPYQKVLSLTARAFLMRPALVLVDITFSIMTKEQQIDYLGLLRVGNTKFEQSIIYGTEEKEYAKIADRILYLDKGKIEEKNVII